MTDPFVAEIRIFGFNFPPKGWAFCDGQLLPLSQNTALFSLLGTMYGGDGKSTFALPDLQGQAAVQEGQSPSGTQYFQGEPGGADSVTLLQSEMPGHTHQAQAASQAATQSSPAPDRAMARAVPGLPYQGDTNANLTQLNFQAASIAGSSLPHNNMPPTLVLNYCIALQGVFPQRP